MTKRFDARKAAFAAAVAASLAFGGQSALAEERGAGQGRHYYCFETYSVEACQTRCAAEGHQWDTYWRRQCCCVDL